MSLPINCRPKNGGSFDIADGRRIAQQHHQPVNANTAAGIGRQTVLKCANIIAVVMHRFIIAALAQAVLFAEYLRLHLRVVLFRKAINQFASGGE